MPSVTSNVLVNFAFVALAVCYSGSVQAQETSEQPANVAVDSGSGNGLGYSPPQVTFRSGIEGEEINLTLGTAADSFNDLSDLSYSFTVTAPYDKDESIGHFITDAGLPATWSAGIDFAYSLSPNFGRASQATRQLFAEYYRQAQAFCRVHFANDAEKLKECEGGSSQLIALMEPINAGLHKKLVETRKQVEKTDSNIPYVGVSVSGKVGRETLSFRDVATFLEEKHKYTPFSFSTTLAWVPNISKPLGLFVGGQYRRSFTLPKKETRCPPGAVGGAAACPNAAYGPPEREIDATTFAAFRLDSTLSEKLPVSIEAKFAYDWKDNDWGVSVPVYLFQNKDEKFNGGIKVEYDSGEKDWSWGVFIGTTFDFLKAF